MNKVLTILLLGAAFAMAQSEPEVAAPSAAQATQPPASGVSPAQVLQEIKALREEQRRLADMVQVKQSQAATPAQPAPVLEASDYRIQLVPPEKKDTGFVIEWNGPLQSQGKAEESSSFTSLSNLLPGQSSLSKTSGVKKGLQVKSDAGLFVGGCWSLALTDGASDVQFGALQVGYYQKVRHTPKSPSDTMVGTYTWTAYYLNAGDFFLEEDGEVKLFMLTAEKGVYAGIVGFGVLAEVGTIEVTTTGEKEIYDPDLGYTYVDSEETNSGNIGVGAWYAIGPMRLKAIYDIGGQVRFEAGLGLSI